MACSDKDYAYLRELVLTESANLIDPSRNALFETRLTPVARLAGVSNLEGLVGLLREDRTTHLHRAVAEAMTINETSFFRDMRPFEALRRYVLPQLIERRESTRRLRIWSAACSTGQEAYSIAMLIAESFPELARWDVKVVGTDISHEVTAYAEKGRFRRIEINRGLSAKLLLKYFTRYGDEWQVHERLRSLVEFQHANLCAPLLPVPQFDLVLLRNVLLYFPHQDRASVFANVFRQMQPDGYLLLGNAEQAEDSTDLFQAEFALDNYFYRPVAR